MPTVTTIEMIPVASSNIQQAGYDWKSRTLRIKFLDSKLLYDFQGVPARVYGELMLADSKGRYFREHIQYRFKFRKVA